MGATKKAFLSAVLALLVFFPTSSFAITESSYWVSSNRSYAIFMSKAEKETSDWALARSIYSASEEFGVDPYLVLAVAKRESEFDWHAYNPDCECHGPMQVNIYPATEFAKAFGSAPGLKLKVRGYNRNPPLALRIGVWYLASKLSRYSDVRVALLAYNGGDAYAAKRARKGRVETPYVRAILASAESFLTGAV